MQVCPNCGYSEKNKPSSIQQRKAYFGIAVTRIADHYSVEKNIMHKALAGAYFGFVDVPVGPIVIKVPATTTGRTTKEMCDYFDWLQKLGADLGLNIPSPDPNPHTREEA